MNKKPAFTQADVQKKAAEIIAANQDGHPTTALMPSSDFASGFMGAVAKEIFRQLREKRAKGKGQ